MTDLLQHAFDKASKLSPKEQNSLATWLLEELKSEKRWDQLFTDSADQLQQLANTALAEHRAGDSRAMDYDKP